MPIELLHRELWEIRVFFLAWLASLIYSFVRTNRQAWLDQLALLSVLLLSLPLFNLFIYSGFSVISLCFDSVLLVTGLLSAFSYRRVLLYGGEKAPPARRSKSALMKAIS